MSVEESKFIKINILNLNRANKFATNDAFNFENNAQHKSILIIFLTITKQHINTDDNVEKIGKVFPLKKTLFLE